MQCFKLCMSGGIIINSHMQEVDQIDWELAWLSQHLENLKSLEKCQFLKKVNENLEKSEKYWKARELLWAISYSQYSCNEMGVATKALALITCSPLKSSCLTLSHWSGKVRETSGNLDIHFLWQSLLENHKHNTRGGKGAATPLNWE